MKKSKKLLIIAFAIIVAGLIYIAGYFNANEMEKQKFNSFYLNGYNQCMLNNHDYFAIDELFQLEYSCNQQGGCFNGCSTACPPTKKEIGFFEVMKYYLIDSFESKACIEICVSRCFYPENSPYFGS